MKKAVLKGMGYLGLMAWAGSVHADIVAAPTSKDLEKVVEDVNYVQTAKSGVVLSGYVDAGYIYNFTNANVNTTGYSSDGGPRGDFNLNAVKLVLEKGLTDANEFQAGFRVDMMVGEDAAGFGSPGVPNTSESFYLQQAYVIVRAPIGNGLDIQMGRINSILGFEADERPANLNITQGINAGPDPGPAVGVLATYPLNDQFALIGGVINGNGLASNPGLDADNDGYAFTGGVGWVNAGGNLESQFAFHYAPWGDPGVGTGPFNQENETILGLNWWGTWAPKFADDKLLLALNSSFWTAQDYTAAGIPAGDDSSEWWVVAAYAKYQVTDIFSVAGRGEYGHNNDDQLWGIGGGSDDVWTLTATAGFDLFENLLLRAEYRVDLGNDVTTGGADVVNTIATEIVYTF